MLRLPLSAVDNKGNLFNSDGQLVHTSGKKDHSSGTTGGASNRNSQQADGTAGSNSKLDGHGDGQGSDPGAGAGAGAGGGGAKTTVPFSTEVRPPGVVHMHVGLNRD